MLAIDRDYRVKVLMFNTVAWRYMKTQIYYEHF
jgi:hypothetical protein